jgi:4-alpha-glucanotransferase
MEAAQARGEQGEGRTLTSVHDQLLAKESGLAALLVYDGYERRSGLVRLSAGNRELGDFVGGAWQLERASAKEAVLRRREGDLEVGKSIVLSGERARPRLSLATEIHNYGQSELVAELEVEWNLNLLGGGGNPAAYYRWGESEGRHDERGELSAATAGSLAFGNQHEGVEVALQAEPAAGVRWYPVETVSNSEAGFERVYQGSCLLLHWPLRLPAGEACRVAVSFDVTQSRDRSAEERT